MQAHLKIVNTQTDGHRMMIFPGTSLQIVS
jgi:hypothetical protein